MRCVRIISLAAISLVTLPFLGCGAGLPDLPGRASPDLQTQIVAARYLAGQYPGTINSTLDDPVVVYHFTYTNGVTLWALLLLHEETGNPAYLDQVRASLVKYDADNLYRPNAGDEPIDYIGSMAHATLEYCRRSGDDRFLGHALETARFFRDDVARTPENLIAYHGNPERGRIWADALFMVAPLMAKAGKLLNDNSYYDDVLAQFRGFTGKLRDPLVGLYHQGWNWHGPGASPGFWGRANGWIALAMAEVLDTIPENYAGREELLASYQDFARAIVAHQGADGMWHQLLDRPESYEETSCTGMFVHALARGVQEGWLTEDYGRAVERGQAGLSRMISLKGDIANICPGTSTQSSEEAYLNRGPRRNDSHGIGPVLLALRGMMTASEAAE